MRAVDFFYLFILFFTASRIAFLKADGNAFVKEHLLGYNAFKYFYLRLTIGLYLVALVFSNYLGRDYYLPFYIESLMSIAIGIAGGLLFDEDFIHFRDYLRHKNKAEFKKKSQSNAFGVYLVACMYWLLTFIRFITDPVLIKLRIVRKRSKPEAEKPAELPREEPQRVEQVKTDDVKTINTILEKLDKF